MGARAKKQLMLLGALGLVLVVMTVMRGGDSPARAPAAAPPGRAAATSGQTPAGAATLDAVADVKLELLIEAREDAADSSRNLFRFGERPAPPPPPRQAAAGRPAPTGPPVPQGPPPPPPITLRLIGLLNAPTQAGRVAVLSDGRGNVFNGREGDIIEGRYRLLRIGADSVELAYTDGRGRQVIRLSGQ